MVAKPVSNRAPLLSTPWIDLPTGAIEPRGWLRDQLRIQADGLTGHLDEIWDSVGPESGWLGGTGESWERGPYYCDGLIPLAYLLHDQRLIAKARAWIEWSLSSQDAEGNFGPQSNPDWWPRMVMLKALLQYQEATGDARVIPFMSRYFRFQLAHIQERPLESWGAARGAENIYCLDWLYNRTGEPFLLDLATLLMQQTLDWTGLFSDFPYTRPTRFYWDILRFMARLDDLSIERSQMGALVGCAHEAAQYHSHHVVNVAMGVKNPALYYQHSLDPRHWQAAELAVEQLARYHGVASGMFTGDEHLSGRDPSQGTELCAVVEYLFSLHTLLKTCVENVAYADLLERIAYNALPAAFSPDMRQHQYDQQANQVLVSVARRQWYDNGDDANVFGLEPHFGCCTANMHQGWPKLAKNLWWASADGGLAAMAYAPCEVRTLVGDGDTEVHIVEETEYPFGEQVHLTLVGGAPAHFALRLRIPGWCRGARAWVNAAEVAVPAGGQYVALEREWQPGDTVTLELPMSIVAEQGYHNAVSLSRGPLVYALAVQEDWRRLKGQDPFADFEVYPASPWNYALVLDPREPERYLTFEQGAVGYQPFSSAQPPSRLHARGRRLPGWTLEHNSAGPLPTSPVIADQPEEEVVLIPYGAAKLRVTELPYCEPDR